MPQEGGGFKPAGWWLSACGGGAEKRICRIRAIGSGAGAIESGQQGRTCFKSWVEDSTLLRAVVVGFVLGFLVVGAFRLSEPGGDGAQLTSAQALHRGAALDHVADEPCEPDRRPILILA
jgi:hypothetical protein